MGAENFRNRVLGCPAVVVDGKKTAGTGTGAVGRANANLEGEGLPPLPVKLTPHSLRRTFCSLLYALGETPARGDAGNGPHGPGARAQGLRAGDAPRRGRDGAMRALVDGGGFGHSMDTNADLDTAEHDEQQAA